ncbi:hypothetical protein PybrP1_008892 [[Pythium] brassicae (nom. inval.)]|nr:hypothetical protein PybrP1_008892 [[Pythium] brassicae (nom. inval.)]
MRGACLLLLPLVLALPDGVRTQNASATSANSTAAELNGWYPCSEFTFADDGTSPSDAECAVYTAPLCYAGVCEDPRARTVDIFVKRIAATAGAATAPNVWFLQGGPGAGSTAMESALVELYGQMSGKVNVYTMDHRGTGRSTLLDCVAAQATASGSPLGGDISVNEVPSCAKAIEVKYGKDLAAFSVTSAATDVSTFISKFQGSTGKTFVYGVSYGTTLVERLIHLENAAIAGYVLDGISTTSGAPAANFEYFSTWDRDFGDVGDYFMTLCGQNTACAARFPGASLAAVLRGVLARFDAAPESECAALVRDVTSGAAGEEVEPASHTVRKALGALLTQSSTRPLIPALTYRLNRCSAADVGVLTHFFNTSSSALSPASEDAAFESTLLYYLIVFSELWEAPTPSLPEMLRRFTDTAICNGGTIYNVPTYCAFSKEASATCASVKVPAYSASPLVYKRDAYWNKAAAIPAGASVLLMSSKLDPQTPHKYAEYLLAALDGPTARKELVTFEHATHGTLWTTPLSESESSSEPTCGMQLLLSYVKASGDLSQLDKSCVAKMPPISFAIDADAVATLLSTTDAFDGEFDPSLSATASGGGDNDSGSSFKGAFAAVLVLLLVAVIAAALFAFGWHRQRKKNKLSAAVANDANTSVQSEPSGNLRKAKEENW